MTADRVVELLAVLRSSGVEATLDGGWGVDALLGRETRPHDDLDLVVSLDEVPRIHEALRPLGFTLHEDQLPVRFVLRRGAEHLDFHTVSFDPGGGGVQPQPGGGSFRYPPEGFVAGEIRGVSVPCISPSVQVLCHLGYEPTDKDARDVLELCRVFGLRVPDAYARFAADRERSIRELGWFFALALGTTAILHGSIAVLGLPFSVSEPTPSLLLYVLGLAAPTLTALVLSGPAGRTRFLRSVLSPRGSAGTYAAAALAQAGIVAAVWVWLRAKGEPAVQLLPSSAFPLLALGQIWVVLGEELGWRGFALPRLERMLSPRLATLVLALAWGVWHAPMFFVPGSLQAREPVWLFALAIFAWSCIHTVLHHRARPSVVPNLVFHACANLSLGLVLLPDSARDELAAVYALVGSVTWLVSGRVSRPARAAAPAQGV